MTEYMLNFLLKEKSMSWQRKNLLILITSVLLITLLLFSLYWSHDRVNLIKKELGIDYLVILFCFFGLFYDTHTFANF